MVKKKGKSKRVSLKDKYKVSSGRFSQTLLEFWKDCSASYSLLFAKNSFSFPTYFLVALFIDTDSTTCCGESSQV
jgi:hypothetical protein